MSGLWTPSGEHRPEAQGEPPTPPPDDAGRDRDGPTDDERAAAEAEMRRIQEELAATPVAELVANHAIGLWQLAVLHLTHEDRDLESAQLAIDALAALVEGLGDRLDPNTEALRDALAQVRLAYVRVSTGGDDAS